MKKIWSLVFVIVMMLTMVPLAKAEPYYVQHLSEEWDFKYYSNLNEVPGDVTKIVFEDKIQVPGAIELQGYGYPGYYYEEMGGWGQPEDDGVYSVGVYKTTIEPMTLSDVNIHFKSVKGNLTVYLNGEKIGESRNGLVGCVISGKLKSGKNELICLVERDMRTINKEDNFALSGIMGDVIVYCADKVDPYEYTYTTDDVVNNVKIENNVLYIDGKAVVLKGIKYTPSHPTTGGCLTDEQAVSDAQLIKDYGFNAVWTSNAPEAFYKEASVCGLYVIEEANVNLSQVDRGMETAISRVKEMIKTHKTYHSIIMWSVGYGTGNSQQLVNSVKELDNRPVAQEVNFAPEFEVLGNTGGMSDWVKTLGDGNVGGFVDEFSDKELYYTRNAYNFTVTDTVTRENLNIDGEISNYKGIDMLGKGVYTRSTSSLDEFTILTYISNANKNRVLFESEDKSIRLETIDHRIRLTVNGQSIDADGGEGKVAAVYDDGEMQLFTSRSFKSNMLCDVSLGDRYTVGEGDGGVLIEYVKIYDKALTIDDLVEDTASDRCISEVDFKNIKVNKDNSYRFLAYGGDFGDEPNSYYKCLTGIFTSTREPHPEAEAFKLLFENKFDSEDIKADYRAYSTICYDSVDLVENEEGFVYTDGKNKVMIDREGRVTSIKKDGNELLTSAIYPTFVRENTLNEYEMGVYNENEWETVNADVKSGSVYVTMKSLATDARATIEYKMTSYGFLYISMQAEFSDTATAPTFIGFRGVGNFDTAQWLGYENSSYPDRKGVSVGTFKKSIADMSDNYAVPQENGNKEVGYMELTGENGTLIFKSASEYDTLYCQVLDYSPEAMENADHDEDIVKDGNTYFRVGGFIKGLSDDSTYALNENVYGYNFFIGTDDYMPRVDVVREVFIDGEELTSFAPHVKDYVYRTNKPVSVTFEGNNAVQDDKKAVAGEYTIYFAPDTEYLSDMTPSEKTAEIALDKDFNGSKINMRNGNDYWAEPKAYEKGVTIKNGTVTYDVSSFTNHTFNAVIGKNDFDWRSMGGFDRNMFSASSSVTITLDGEVVYEKKDVSMRSGNEEVNIDVSNAKSMTISVNANGQANNYSDAVLANAAFVPDGPIVVNFEKKNGKAEIIVLNTDEDFVEVVLTATQGSVVTTESARIGKGLYRTVEIKAEENAVVKAYITSLGEIVLE